MTNVVNRPGMVKRRRFFRQLSAKRTKISTGWNDTKSSLGSNDKNQLVLTKLNGLADAQRKAYSCRYFRLVV